MKTLSLIFVLMLAGPAWAGIELSQDYPRANEPVELTLTTASGFPAAGVEVKAGYGPGSELLRETSLGTTDNAGKLSWTPEEAGLVALSAEAQGADGPEALASSISVQFDGAPVSGLLVMLVAGLILYGGVIAGFRRMGKPVPSWPPDT